LRRQEGVGKEEQTKRQGGGKRVKCLSNLKTDATEGELEGPSKINKRARRKQEAWRSGVRTTKRETGS